MFELKNSAPEAVESSLKLIYADNSFCDHDFYTDHMKFKVGGLGFRGTTERVPRGGIVEVTSYDGKYIHPEDIGFSVGVTVRGTAEERDGRNDPFAEYGPDPNPPSRYRYYYDYEILPGVVEIDRTAFALKAAARAVHDVVNGMNAEGNLERIHGVKSEATARRVKEEQDSERLAAHNKEVERQLFIAQPKLVTLERQMVDEALSGNIDMGMDRLLDFWELRDMTLETLGLKFAYKISDLET